MPRSKGSSRKGIFAYTDELQISKPERHDFMVSLRKLRDNDPRFQNDEFVNWSIEKIRQHAQRLANTWLHDFGGERYWGPGNRQTAWNSEDSDDGGNIFQQQHLWPKNAKELQEKVAIILELQIRNKAVGLRSQRPMSQPVAVEVPRNAPNLDTRIPRKKRPKVVVASGPVPPQTVNLPATEAIIEISSSSENESNNDDKADEPLHRGFSNRRRVRMRRAIGDADDPWEESSSCASKRLRTDITHPCAVAGLTTGDSGLEQATPFSISNIKDLMNQYEEILKASLQEQKESFKELQKRQAIHQREMRNDVDKALKINNNTANEGRQEFLDFLETEFKSSFLVDIKAAMAEEFKEWKALHERQAKLLPVLRCRTHRKDWCYQCNLPDTSRGRALVNHVRRPPSRARRTPGLSASTNTA